MVKKKSSPKNHSKKYPFVFLFLLIIALPLLLWAVYQQIRLNPKAYTPKLSSATPNIDPQTGDYYDLQLDTYPVENKEYEAITVFRANGTRLNNIQTLHGFLQAPYNTEVTFNLTGEYFPKFKSNPVALRDNGCLDLYSSLEKNKKNYIGTSCYRITGVSVGSSRKTAYSPSANPFFEFTFSGTKSALILSLTTVFNKYNSNPAPYDGVHMTRVTYLTIDSAANLSDFKNPDYFFTGFINGLSGEEISQLCELESQYPKKYVKQSWETKPEGGSNYELNEKVGYCTFKLHKNYFIPAFLSLYMDGGVIPTPTPTSPPKPTCKPRPACLDAKPPCKIPDAGYCPLRVIPSQRISPAVTLPPSK